MTTRAEAIEKINDMIGDIKVAMLTTVDEHGHLHSRPMVTQEHEFDGDLWFFADRTSDKVNEIINHPTVNVSYMGGSNYVSLAGDATIVTDVHKKKTLWNPAHKVWFEQGPESPDVVLIRVGGHTAQYWDAPGGGIVGKAVAMVRVLLTGDEDAAGDSEAVTL